MLPAQSTPNAEYRSLDLAFEFFNQKLFDGKLPPALITLRNHARARGYFRSRAFQSRHDAETTTDEIALCADTFHTRTDKDVLSTLLHEQCHLWQSRFGHMSRRGYHNIEWAAKMLEIGLHPSDTGLPGGKMTGQRMTHYIVEGGRFDLAATELIAGGWRLQWQEWTPPVAAATLLGGIIEQPTAKKLTRKKFVCAKCGLIAWAKFSARLTCGACAVGME